MDLITNISRNVEGLFLENNYGYEFIDYITRRDLWKIAKRFKEMYDIYVCAMGHNLLHIKLITDFGFVDINIKRINTRDLTS